jgi:hypothetical protein
MLGSEQKSKRIRRRRPLAYTLEKTFPDLSWQASKLGGAPAFTKHPY